MINTAKQDNTRRSFRTLIIQTLRFYAGRLSQFQRLAVGSIPDLEPSVRHPT